MLRTAGVKQIMCTASGLCCCNRSSSAAAIPSSRSDSTTGIGIVTAGISSPEQPHSCAQAGGQPSVHEETQVEFAEAASAAIADGSDAGQLLRQYADICRMQAAKLRSGRSYIEQLQATTLYFHTNFKSMAIRSV